MLAKRYQIVIASILAVLIVYTWPTKNETQAFMQTVGTDDIYAWITGNLPEVKEGATPWQTFEKVGEIKVNESDKETGYEYEYFKPEYTDEIKAMDGKTIRLMGFMFPLTPREQQLGFLIGPYALSCPYHYHVNPKFIIEVDSSNNPIEFTYDAIVVEGKFEVKFDKETQVFYYLRDAKLIKKNP